MDAAIALEGVSFRYPNQKDSILDQVSLKVAPGECVVLTGPSGCGKTTLTRLVNGLIPHAYEGELSGRVWVNGRDVSEWTADELGVEVGSAFQNPRGQFVNIDVASEIAFGCECLGLPPDEIAERVDAAAAALGIRGLVGRSISELSGGQKQSVILASAWAMHPDVFVLDEPTASLDTASMRRLARVLSQLKSQGKTILVSEHRLWWLAGIADRVVAMEDGRLQAQWDAADFGRLTSEERSRRGLRAWSDRELYERRSASGSEKAAIRAGMLPRENAGLHARELTAGYKRGAPILRDASIALTPGRITGIVGENGAGKSTLLRCLCGLTKESRGTISIEGKKRERKQRPAFVHLVMQEPGYQLFSDSVLKEAESACGNSDDAEKVHGILERFGLLGLLDRHPLSLSGGERQRLSIAAGMLRGSCAMLLDEPTSGLDYRNMQGVAAALRDAADEGCAIGIVTHDLELLCEACDEVAEVEDGRICTTYPLDDEGRARAAARLGFCVDQISGYIQEKGSFI